MTISLKAKDVEINHFTEEEYQYIRNSVQEYPDTIELYKIINKRNVQSVADELVYCLGHWEEIAYLEKIKMIYSHKQHILKLDFVWTKDRQDIDALLDTIATEVSSDLKGDNLEADLKVIRNYFKSWQYRNRDDYLGNTFKDDLQKKKTNCQGFSLIMKKILEKKGYKVDYVVGTRKNEKQKDELHAWIEVQITDQRDHIVNPTYISLSHKLPLSWTTYESMGSSKLEPTKFVFRR